jgi:hypothetical protein
MSTEYVLPSMESFGALNGEERTASCCRPYNMQEGNSE